MTGTSVVCRTDNLAFASTVVETHSLWTTTLLQSGDHVEGEGSGLVEILCTGTRLKTTICLSVLIVCNGFLDPL